MISLAIVEDDPVIRSALLTFLQTQDAIQICGDYESAEGFLMRDEAPPDVLLLDIELPGINGLEAAFLVKEKYPQTQILIFTVYEDPERIFRALQSGVSGYLLKNTPLNRLLSALTEVAEGGAPMSPPIARKVMAYFAALPPMTANNSIEQLTPREREVAAALVEGQSYRQVAGDLFISVDTIRQHIKNIYRKLHVNSRTQLIKEFHRAQRPY